MDFILNIGIESFGEERWILKPSGLWFDKKFGDYINRSELMFRMKHAIAFEIAD